MADTEESLEVSYYINNAIYRVIGNAELHYLLQNDPEFSHEYFKENEGTSEITDTHCESSSPVRVVLPEAEISEEYHIGKEEIPDEISEEVPEEIPEETSTTVIEDILQPQDNEFSWSRSNTWFLIKSYKSYKELFKNPKIKNRNAWEYILKEFRKKGYSDLTVDTLDRKLRNLKKTYRTIKENRSKNSQSRIRWEYYDSLHDVFLEDKITRLIPKDTNETNTSDISSISSCFVIPKLDTDKCEELIKPSTDTIIDVKSRVQTTDTFQKGLKGKQFYKFRKKMLEIEKQRVEEIKKLRESIDLSNKIQEERNKILKSLQK